MRISDWSSDVCSSDLLAVSRGLPYAAGIEALTLAPARIFGVADQMGSIAPGKAADIVIWDGAPLEPLTQPTALFIARSEEHTPELQSLMRISYAVFCLNKKQLHNTTYCVRLQTQTQQHTR